MRPFGERTGDTLALLDFTRRAEVTFLTGLRAVLALAGFAFRVTAGFFAAGAFLAAAFFGAVFLAGFFAVGFLVERARKSQSRVGIPLVRSKGRLN